MDLSTLSNIAVIVTALSAVVALIFIFFQLRQQTRQLKFQALTAVHKEVFSKEFRKALGIIFRIEPKNVANCKSREIDESIRLVAGLYDLVGARIQEGVLPKKATLKTEWKILVFLWDHIKDFIDCEEKRRKVPYKEHLKWLVAEAEKFRIKHSYEIPQKSLIDYADYEFVSPTVIVSESSKPKLLYRGKHLHFYRGKNYWEYVHRPNACGGVTIVAVTENNQIILVEQFRVPLVKRVIELPAGLVGDETDMKSEELKKALKRELKEETGYSCKRVIILSEGPVLPGLTDEINTICLAEKLKKVDGNEVPLEGYKDAFMEKERGLAEEGESITVYRIPLQSVISFLEDQKKNGKDVDLRVYSGMFFLKGDQRKLLFNTDE